MVISPAGTPMSPGRTSSGCTIFTRWATAAVATMLAVLSTIAQPARADSEAMERFGINEPLYRYSGAIHGGNPTPPNDYAAECDEIIASGIKWVRMSPEWAKIQPNVGPAGYDQDYLDVLDEIVDRLTSNGVNIVWILCYSVPWASTAPPQAPLSEVRFYAPNLADWDTYVRFICNRYKGKIFHWEVWNEQDNDVFWKTDPDTAPDAVDVYRDLLEVSQDAIRDMHTDNVVLLGGLTGAGASFLSQLIDGPDVGTYFDIVNYHTYKDSPGMVSTYKNFTGVMNSKNIADKKIWITELGFSADTPSLEPRKADWVDQAYVTHFSMPHVERIFWYIYRAPANSGEDPYFGLQDANREPFKAYAYYQAVNGAESNFLLQKTYPSAAAERLTLTYVDATSGDGVVQDYVPDGSIKEIPAGGYMYFRINNNWICDANGGLDPKVTVEVTHWNASHNPWLLQYHSQSSTTQQLWGSRTNTQEWVTSVFELDDIKMANGQNHQADFRLFAGSYTPLIVSKVVVRREMNPARVVLGEINRFKLLDHVIEPDTTNPAHNPVDSILGIECRTIPNGSSYMYFKVSDGLIRTGNTNVTVGVRYYDSGGGTINIQYVPTGNEWPNYVNVPIQKGDTNQWKYSTVTLTDAKFDNSMYYGADFRISSGSDNSPEYVEMVDVTRN